MFISDSEIDFHDFGPMTQIEIEQKLEQFIEDEYAKGSTNLLVITGKGKVVKPLVEKLLKVSKFVRTFKTAGYYNGQTGAFEVILKD
jgi:DNA-nicking Smr family endonuclease